MRITEKLSEKPPSQLTEDALIELKTLAASYKTEGRYREAIQVLSTIINQKEGCYKIRPYIDKARCFIDADEPKLARMICAEIIAIIEASESSEVMKRLREECDCDIRDLAQVFIEQKDCDTALMLARCRLQMIRYFYTGESRLQQLERSGLLLQNIAEEMADQDNQGKSKQQYKMLYPLLGETLAEMQKIGNVNIKVKSKKIAWFLKYFGFCCDEVHDFNKSLVVYQQAIAILKTVFAAECNKHRILGYCYNNLAYVYENTNQLNESRRSLKRAIDIFNSATDWPSKEERDKCINKACTNLQSMRGKSSKNCQRCR